MHKLTADTKISDLIKQMREWHAEFMTLAGHAEDKTPLYAFICVDGPKAAAAALDAIEAVKERLDRQEKGEAEQAPNIEQRARELADALDENWNTVDSTDRTLIYYHMSEAFRDLEAKWYSLNRLADTYKGRLEAAERDRDIWAGTADALNRKYSHLEHERDELRAALQGPLNRVDRHFGPPLSRGWDEQKKARTLLAVFRTDQPEEPAGESERKG